MKKWNNYGHKRRRLVSPYKVIALMQEEKNTDSEDYSYPANSRGYIFLGHKKERGDARRPFCANLCTGTHVIRPKESGMCIALHMR